MLNKIGPLKIISLKASRKITISYFSTYYELLGIKKNATLKEIKEAYFKQAKVYHPDRNSTSNTEEHFKKIQNAYEILKDSEKKAEYDQILEGNIRSNQDKQENYDSYNNWRKENKSNSYNKKWENSSEYAGYQNNFFYYRNFYNKKQKQDKKTKQKYSYNEQAIYRQQILYRRKVYAITICSLTIIFYIFDQNYINSKSQANHFPLPKQDPFSNEKISNLNSTDFENISGIAFNHRIHKDSEMLRMKLMQIELNAKKIKIEVGSNDIYNPFQKKKEQKKRDIGLNSNIAKKMGVFKAVDIENDEKIGTILTVKDYRDRFA